MISELVNHISDDQLNEVVIKILEQYSKFKRITCDPDFEALFAEEYSSHKKQHSLSWAISSAFPSGDTIAEDLRIEKLEYGRGHTRPLIFNNKIELHILSNTTDFKSKYLQERYAMNSDYTDDKLFCYILFTEKNEELLRLDLILPDINGRVYKKESIKTSTEITYFVNNLATVSKVI